METDSAEGGIPKQNREQASTNLFTTVDALLGKQAHSKS